MLQIDYIQAYQIIKPLAIFVSAMVLYSIFIFKFYRFLGKKDIISFNLSKYNTAEHWLIKSFFGTIFYIIEYILLLPIVIFFWFIVLSTLLTFLAKSQPIESILLVSIALVGAVRVTSYYNEDLSKDLAKMLPFALLGVFLIDISFFSFATSLSIIKQIPSQVNLLIYYLAFIMIIELFLRIIDIFTPNNPPKSLNEKNNTF